MLNRASNLPRKRSQRFLPLSQNIFASSLFCGEGEIRTPEELSPLPRFECGAFNHSATSPNIFRYQSNLSLLFLHDKNNNNIFCVFIKKCYIGLRVWPYRLTVRTRPFQGCNRGSIPRKVTDSCV